MKFKLMLLLFSLMVLSCSSNDETLIEATTEIILNKEYEVEFNLDDFLKDIDGYNKNLIKELYAN